jgi:hypothetical protein
VPRIELVGRSAQAKSVAAPAGQASGSAGRDNLGALELFTDDLFDGQNQKVGEHSGLCTVVRGGTGGANTYQCFATFTLPDGQITARGVITDFSQPFTVAITGGTESYQNARGMVNGWPDAAANETRFQLDVRG